MEQQRRWHQDSFSSFSFILLIFFRWKLILDFFENFMSFPFHNNFAWCKICIKFGRKSSRFVWSFRLCLLGVPLLAFFCSKDLSNKLLTARWIRGRSRENVEMDLSTPLIISLNIIKSFYSFRSSRGPARMTNAAAEAWFRRPPAVPGELLPHGCQTASLNSF